MRLSARDKVATGLVAVAALLYLLWTIDAALPGLGSVRATVTAVLALGFLASAIAVVPTFVSLLHGNRAYLAVTSVLGVVALVGGIQALLAQSVVGLAVLVAATVVLWLIATMHHRALAMR